MGLCVMVTVPKFAGVIPLQTPPGLTISPYQFFCVQNISLVGSLIQSANYSRVTEQYIFIINSEEQGSRIGETHYLQQRCLDRPVTPDKHVHFGAEVHCELALEHKEIPDFHTIDSHSFALLHIERIQWFASFLL
jgi:hypothetical protein